MMFTGYPCSRQAAPSWKCPMKHVRRVRASFSKQSMAFPSKQPGGTGKRAAQAGHPGGDTQRFRGSEQLADHFTHGTSYTPAQPRVHVATVV